MLTGEALSPLMGRSDTGTVIHVEDTDKLGGDATFGAGYLWTDAVTDYNPLFDTQSQSVDLNDDQVSTTSRMQQIIMMCGAPRKRGAHFLGGAELARSPASVHFEVDWRIVSCARRLQRNTAR